MIAKETQNIWAERWQAAIENSVMRRREKKTDPIQRWNKMAADFAKRTSTKENDQKRQSTIAWLKESGALTKDSEILDIGAGPGNWALLLAKEGGHVTALEPADGMVNILETRKREEHVDNITIARRTWQAVDLVQEKWQEKFDLVFASMTPGIDGPKTLEKLMAASRGFCYLSAFSGRHWQHWYGDLWKIIFGEEIDARGNDIINPFNLVYAMGYRPELKFDFWEHDINWPRDKAIEDFTSHLEQYTEISESVKSTIEEYVDEHSENGVFSHTRKGCRGMMLWDINNQLQQGI